MKDTPGKNDLMLPLASIVVLTRNRADSLARTLRTLQAQDYPNYEIGDVQNHSTDHKAQVVTGHSGSQRLAPG